MPTYQYACTECGGRVEAVQGFADPPLVECGSCGGRLRKVFSPVGVVFKGSGFYRTDSRAAANGSAASRKKSDGDRSSAERSTESATTDSKKQASDGKGESKGSEKSAGTSTEKVA